MSPGGMVQADAHCRVAGLDKVYVAGDSGSYPGPDWGPKQAHMADLQAVAAAANLRSGLRGERADKTFRLALICIMDSLGKGILVYRDAKRTLILPPCSLLHWRRRVFEQMYLRAYR